MGKIKRTFSGNLTIDGDLSPSSDIKHDVGKSDARVRNFWVKFLHTGDITFKNGWSLTEDGDEIVLLSPQGRKFRFQLKEVKSPSILNRLKRSV